MSRILMPIGDTMLEHSTLDFAAFIAKQMRSPVTVAPLKIDHVHELATSEEAAMSSGIEAVPLRTANVASKHVHYQQDLVAACNSSFAGFGVLANTRKGAPVSLKGLIGETNYSDLLILEGNLSIQTSVLETNPTHYVKELLHQSECPVFIAPLSFRPPEDILFAFDGSASAIFALKQFVLLFPDLCRKNLVVLEINQEGVPGAQRQMLVDWLSDHFMEAEFVLLPGIAEDRLLEYALTKHQSMIVMGGYGRSMWSRLLTPSTSAAVVKIISSPVFIAHN